MKKLLALLMLVLPVVGMENNVEENLDEVPKFTQVYTGVCPDSFFQWGHVTNAATYKTIEKKMLLLGMISRRLDLDYFYDENAHNPVGLFGGNNKYLFLLRQTNEDLNLTSFLSFKTRVRLPIFLKNNWVPNTPLTSHLTHPKVTEMSLAYIKCALYSRPHYDTFSEWEIDLFHKIKLNGLDNTIKRAVAVFDKKNNWAIYTPSEDKDAESLVKVLWM
jgi:hypothetical protein